MRLALEAAQTLAWRRLGSPGTWWTAADRLAIVRETRATPDCRFCQSRAAALSPLTVSGQHATTEASLPAPAIEAIHRIRTDPGRPGRNMVPAPTGRRSDGRGLCRAGLGHRRDRRHRYVPPSRGAGSITASHRRIRYPFSLPSNRRKARPGFRRDPGTGGSHAGRPGSLPGRTGTPPALWRQHTPRAQPRA